MIDAGQIKAARALLNLHQMQLASHRRLITAWVLRSLVCSGAERLADAEARSVDPSLCRWAAPRHR